MAEYIIKKEEEALKFLSQALDGYWQDSDIIKFSGWPKFELIIRVRGLTVVCQHALCVCLLKFKGK